MVEETRLEEFFACLMSAVETNLVQNLHGGMTPTFLWATAPFLAKENRFRFFGHHLRLVDSFR
jgi:hypothetical protein